MRVVVLGGGSSGEHFVGALRRLDNEAELTLVERRLVGGECSYWACMPTKTMLRAPELVAAARHAPGVEVTGLVPAEVFRWLGLSVTTGITKAAMEEAQRAFVVDPKAPAGPGAGSVVIRFPRVRAPVTRR